MGNESGSGQPRDSLALNQKQFVEIARELDNQNVRLLMLDEPTSSLNITETKGLLTVYREIARKESQSYSFPTGWTRLWRCATGSAAEGA